MDNLAIHFGAGNIGRGFIAPVLQSNGYKIIFVDIDDSLISKLNSTNKYHVSNFLNSKDDILVDNISGIELNNLKELESALSQADLISTSVGPNHLLSVIESIVNVQFEKNPSFIAFENKYRASSITFKEAKVDISKLNIIDAVVDKIVPPQPTESLDVIVEEFGSIVLEDQAIKPLEPSEVLSYGDYEKEFIKKLWILNGLHLKLAYFGLANNKKFMHELFEDDESIEFSRKAANSLGEAYLLFDKDTASIDIYKETTLKRFAAPEVKDDLLRVARNPMIKFNRLERFHAPLDLLIKNNFNVETFRSVFEILLKEDFKNIQGFSDFKKLFENGIENFLDDFWNVGSNLEKYLTKLK
jgi:mannitol-1-phosphate 5-dehydrogenase